MTDNIPVAKAMIGVGYIVMAIAGTWLALEYNNTQAYLAGAAMWAFFIKNRVTP